MSKAQGDVATRGVGKAIFIIESFEKIDEILPNVLREFASKVEEEIKAEAPVYLGIMRDSVISEIDEGKLMAKIGPTTSYAPFVSSFTRAHFIEANIQVSPGIWRFIRLHPGTRANPYLEESLERTIPLLRIIMGFHVLNKVVQISQQAKEFDLQE